LEAKEVVITGLREDIQKLLLETKENRLVIAKQVHEIEELCRQRSHASTVDDIQNPTDDETHAHDTNMLVDNDFIDLQATLDSTTSSKSHSSIP
jgi:thymidine kinase